MVQCIVFGTARMGRCIALARRTGQCGCGSTPWARRTDCGRTPMKLQTHRRTVTKYHNSISLYLPLTLHVYRARHGYQLGSLTVQTITAFLFQDFDFASVWVISFRFWFGMELESFGGLFISCLASLLTMSVEDFVRQRLEAFLQQNSPIASLR